MAEELRISNESELLVKRIIGCEFNNSFFTESKFKQGMKRKKREKHKDIFQLHNGKVKKKIGVGTREKQSLIHKLTLKSK